MSQFFEQRCERSGESFIDIGLLLGDKEGRQIFEFDSDIDEGLPIGVGESITLKHHLTSIRFQTLHIHVFSDVEVDVNVEWNDDPFKEGNWAQSISFNMSGVSPSGVGQVASVRTLAQYVRLNISNADLINPVTNLRFSVFAFPL